MGLSCIQLPLVFLKDAICSSLLKLTKYSDHRYQRFTDAHRRYSALPEFLTLELFGSQSGPCSVFNEHVSASAKLL